MKVNGKIKRTTCSRMTPRSEESSYSSAGLCDPPCSSLPGSSRRSFLEFPIYRRGVLVQYQMTFYIRVIPQSCWLTCSWKTQECRTLPCAVHIASHYRTPINDPFFNLYSIRGSLFSTTESNRIRVSPQWNRCLLAQIYGERRHELQLAMANESGHSDMNLPILYSESIYLVKPIVRGGSQCLHLRNFCAFLHNKNYSFRCCFLNSSWKSSAESGQGGATFAVAAYSKDRMFNNCINGKRW